MPKVLYYIGKVLPKGKRDDFQSRRYLEHDELTERMTEVLGLNSMPHLFNHFPAAKIGRILQTFSAHKEKWVVGYIDDSTVFGRYAMGQIQEGLMTDLSLTHRYRVYNRSRGYHERKNFIEVSSVEKGERADCEIKHFIISENSLPHPSLPALPPSLALSPSLSVSPLSTIMTTPEPTPTAAPVTVPVPVPVPTPAPATTPAPSEAQLTSTESADMLLMQGLLEKLEKSNRAREEMKKEHEGFKRAREEQDKAFMKQHTETQKKRKKAVEDLLVEKMTDPEVQTVINDAFPLVLEGTEKGPLDVLLPNANSAVLDMIISYTTTLKSDRDKLAAQSQNARDHAFADQSSRVSKPPLFTPSSSSSSSSSAPTPESARTPRDEFSQLKSRVNAALDGVPL